MKRASRRLAVMLAAAIMLLTVLPVSAAGVKGYDQHDVEKLREFFSCVSNLNVMNGVAINGADYDPNDPSGWVGCTWNSAGRLTAVDFSYSGAVGNLDLSGCEALVTVSCAMSKLTGVNVTGCPLLHTLEVDNNKITSVDVSGCPDLEQLWLGTNQLTEVDISHNPGITRLNLIDNKLTSLDVSGCTGLTYLDVGNNRLTELDVSACHEITELNCKNNLLTELDIGGCVNLQRLRALGNRIKRLDLSVMNGGVEYVLEASGSGYVGTKCFIDSTGAHTYGSSNADSGAAFYGWYDGDSQVTSAGDMQCVFGQGEGHFTARFEGGRAKLEIDYVFEDGSEAAPSYTAELDTGASYSVPSPDIEGYYADTAEVAGVMGASDTRVTVVYHPIPGDLLMGDIDDNGVINSLDALYLLRYTLDLLEPTPHMLLAGDVDGSGTINALDVLLIVRMSLQLV